MLNQKFNLDLLMDVSSPENVIEDILKTFDFKVTAFTMNFLEKTDKHTVESLKARARELLYAAKSYSEKHKCDCILDHKGLYARCEYNYTNNTLNIYMLYTCKKYMKDIVMTKIQKDFKRD